LLLKLTSLITFVPREVALNNLQYNHIMKIKIKVITLLLVAAGFCSLNSCLPLAAGAAVGYVAHKDGYRVNSPIHKH